MFFLFPCDICSYVPRAHEKPHQIPHVFAHTWRIKAHSILFYSILFYSSVIGLLVHFPFYNHERATTLFITDDRGSPAFTHIDTPAPLCLWYIISICTLERKLVHWCKHQFEQSDHHQRRARAVPAPVTMAMHSASSRMLLFMMSLTERKCAEITWMLI